jgi:hypothetical protein
LLSPPLKYYSKLSSANADFIFRRLRGGAAATSLVLAVATIVLLTAATLALLAAVMLEFPIVVALTLCAAAKDDSVEVATTAV